jgi:hypothetical protein
MRVLGGRGASACSLGEMAAACGIPAKLSAAGEHEDGEGVVDRWLRGEIGEIVAYNEVDAVTTYLLWLRTAHFAGHFTGAQYAEEEGHVERLLEERAEAGAIHLAAFLERWRVC